MRNALPMVKTIERPDEVAEWPRFVKNLECFSKFEVTEEDVNKTKQYHGRAKFVRDSSNKADIVGYLKEINLRPVASNLSSPLMPRAVQLCSKTNQYNLRTIRHSAEDLLDLYSKNNDFCFLVGLSDNYGDHGMVALVCLKKINKKLLFLDTFLMSCRVLGRHLESWVLSEIIRRARMHGFEYLVGEFIPTERNTVAKSFFTTYGFTAIEVGSDIYNEVIGSNFSQGSDLFIKSVSSTKIPYIEIYE
jgi:FkbH-like protein